jgi:hypothetical protein
MHCDWKTAQACYRPSHCGCCDFSSAFRPAGSRISVILAFLLSLFLLRHLRPVRRRDFLRPSMVRAEQKRAGRTSRGLERRGRCCLLARIWCAGARVATPAAEPREDAPAVSCLSPDWNRFRNHRSGAIRCIIARSGIFRPYLHAPTCCARSNECSNTLLGLTLSSVPASLAGRQSQPPLVQR